MKVKKFVEELDKFIDDSKIKTPKIVDTKETQDNCNITSIDFSKNSIVYLIAGVSEGMDPDEFDKTMTRVRLIRPNATIAVKLNKAYHVDMVYSSNVVNGEETVYIQTGSVVKEK